MSFQTVREALATALDNPTAWTVYVVNPGTVVPRSIVIEPAGTWVSPLTTGRTAVELGFTLRLAANTADNLGTLIALEDMIEDVIALLPSWAQFQGVTAPQYDQGATGDLATADLTISVPATL